MGEADAEWAFRDAACARRIARGVRAHRGAAVATLAAVALAAAALSLPGCGAKSALGSDPAGEEGTVDAGGPVAPEDAGEDTGRGAGADAGLDGGHPPADAGADAGPDAVPDGGPDPDPERPALCVELAPDGTPLDLTIAYREQTDAADVLILFDTTASMGLRIAMLREEFRAAFLPAISATARDLRVGLATFRDFDLSDDGGPPRPGVRSTLFPFRLDVPLTRDPDAVLDAFDRLTLVSTDDWPESQVEALYQIATGEGHPGAVDPGPPCPRGQVGYPCFRERFAPVVLLFTDAPFHEGPGGVFPYPRDSEGHLVVRSRTFAQAASALRDARVRVAGFWSGYFPGGISHVRAMATESGAVDAWGQPVVMDLGAPGIVPRTLLVSAIRRLFDEDPLDVTLALEDLGGDDGDALRLVTGYETLRPEPFDGARQYPDRYADVWIGTRVGFEVTLSDARPEPPPRTLRYRLALRMVGDGWMQLRQRTVTIVVPGMDGGGCED